MSNQLTESEKLINDLKNRSLWARKETLELYKIFPNFRLASSLSDIEIFVSLYYGGILKFDPKDPRWEERDRFIISKGHGAVSLYPILADLGFFDKKELFRISQEGSFLSDIPDTRIPGFETINGSLGHGLGVAAGMGIALNKKKSRSKVFVLVGDGELYEGALWEAVMFTAQHRVGNLTLIIDRNKIAMLDYCKNIIDLEPLEEKFRVFGWETKRVDGHNVEELYTSLRYFKENKLPRPKVLIADTIKGRGVPELENDVLCHVKSLKEEEINKAIKQIDEQQS